MDLVEILAGDISEHEMPEIDREELRLFDLILNTSTAPILPAYAQFSKARHYLTFGNIFEAERYFLRTLTYPDVEYKDDLCVDRDGQIPEEDVFYTAPIQNETMHSRSLYYLTLINFANREEELAFEKLNQMSKISPEAKRYARQIRLLYERIFEGKPSKSRKINLNSTSAETLLLDDQNDL